ARIGMGNKISACSEKYADEECRPLFMHCNLSPLLKSFIRFRGRITIPSLYEASDVLNLVLNHKRAEKETEPSCSGVSLCSVTAAGFRTGGRTCKKTAFTNYASRFFFFFLLFCLLLSFDIPDSTATSTEDDLRSTVERLKLENRKLEERLEKIQERNNAFNKMVSILKRENSGLERLLRRERAKKDYNDRAWKEMSDTINQNNAKIHKLEEKNAELREQVEKQNELLQKKDKELEKLRRSQEQADEDEHPMPLTLVSPSSVLSDDEREGVDALRMELMEYEEFAKALKQQRAEEKRDEENADEETEK
ncbi:MAG: hypothetical protein ACOCZS_01210, partial [Verrucomicrobiota bacterium]